MWMFITNQFSVSQQGFSQSWMFWAVVEALIIAYLACLLWKTQRTQKPQSR